MLFDVLMFLMFLFTAYSYSDMMKNLRFPKELKKTFPKVQCISKNVFSEGI